MMTINKQTWLSPSTASASPLCHMPRHSSEWPGPQQSRGGSVKKITEEFEHCGSHHKCHPLPPDNAQENPKVHLLRMLVLLVMSPLVPGGLFYPEHRVTRLQFCWFTLACRCSWEAHTEESHHTENAETAILALESLQLKIWVIFLRKPDQDLEASWEQMLQQCSAWKTLLILENIQIPLAIPNITWN